MVNANQQLLVVLVNREPLGLDDKFVEGKTISQALAPKPTDWNLIDGKWIPKDKYLPWRVSGEDADAARGQFLNKLTAGGWIVNRYQEDHWLFEAIKDGSRYFFRLLPI